MFKTKSLSCKITPSVPGQVLPSGALFKRSVTLFGLAFNDIAKVFPTISSAHSMKLTFFVSYASPCLDVTELKVLDKLSQSSLFAHESRCSAFQRVVNSLRDLDLQFHGTKFPIVEQAHFLGIIFDRRLTWVPHLRNLKVASLNTCPFFGCSATFLDKPVVMSFSDCIDI